MQPARNEGGSKVPATPLTSTCSHRRERSVLMIALHREADSFERQALHLGELVPCHCLVLVLCVELEAFT